MKKPQTEKGAELTQSPAMLASRIATGLGDRPDVGVLSPVRVRKAHELDELRLRCPKIHRTGR